MITEQQSATKPNLTSPAGIFAVACERGGWYLGRAACGLRDSTGEQTLGCGAKVLVTPGPCKFCSVSARQGMLAQMSWPRASADSSVVHGMRVLPAVSVGK